MTRVVLVPGVLALLPEYAGLEDPVADLRAACLAAVSWLTDPVEVVADEQGARVADHLLAATTRAPGPPSYLVVGNHLDRVGQPRDGREARGPEVDDRVLEAGVLGQEREHARHQHHPRHWSPRIARRGGRRPAIDHTMSTT